MGFVEGKEPIAGRGPCRWVSGIALRAACCVLLLDAGAGLFSGQPFSDAGTGHGLFVTHGSASKADYEAPPMPYITGKMLMDTISEFAVSVIEEAAMKNVIPPQEGDRFSVEEMRLQGFTVASVKADLASMSADQASVDMADVKTDIGATRFVFDCGLFNCPGTMRAKVDKTQMHSDIHAHNEDEHMRVEVGSETTDVAWGDVAFEYEFDDWYCRVAVWIVELFTKLLYDVVLVYLKEQLIKILNQLLQELINYLLKTSGLRLSKQFAIGSLQKTRQLEFIPPKLHSSSATPSLKFARAFAALGEEASFSEEPPLTNDIGAVLSRDSVNAFLLRATRAGSLNYAMELSPSMVAEYVTFVIPDVTEMCPGCRVLLSVAAKSEAPVVDFDASGSRLAMRLKDVEVALFVLPVTDAQQAAVLARLASSATGTVNPPASAGLLPPASAKGLWPVPLVSFAVDLTAAVKDVSVDGEHRNLINYEVEAVTGLSVKLLTSNIGSVEARRVKSQMNTILNLLAVPYLNQNSPYKLPEAISDVLLEINADHIVAGFNMSHM